jgi:hypothetical protein
MFQLKPSGVPALEPNGALLTGRASQRHRIALLALLALAPGRRLSPSRSDPRFAELVLRVDREMGVK